MRSEILAAMVESPLLPELLQEGQAILAREQERREKFYRDITPEQKWEFIQGEVIMHSPALHRHTRVVQHLSALLNLHVFKHRCGTVCSEKAMTVFPRNDYEPDIVFFGLTKAAQIGHDTLKYPIPDLVVEVLSPSTEKRDRGVKFNDFAMHGVREYWIIDPVAETVEAYRLTEDAYPPTEPKRDGLLTSEVVHGFEIPVRALFAADEHFKATQKIVGAP